MIIFDLDGTLADCEHRRHFLEDPVDSCWNCYNAIHKGICVLEDFICDQCGRKPCSWKYDLKSFYESCDKDEPIEPMIEVFNRFSYDIYGFPNEEIQIWSGRCESALEKTEKWLEKHLLCFEPHQLKMRPIGDSTPLYKLKERWYDLHNVQHPRNNIEFVFDSDQESIKMWRRRGIFVFDCCQHNEDE